MSSQPNEREFSAAFQTDKIEGMSCLIYICTHNRRQIKTPILSLMTTEGKSKGKFRAETLYIPLSLLAVCYIDIDIEDAR